MEMEREREKKLIEEPRERNVKIRDFEAFSMLVS